MTRARTSPAERSRPNSRRRLALVARRAMRALRWTVAPIATHGTDDHRQNRTHVCQGQDFSSESSARSGSGFPTAQTFLAKALAGRPVALASLGDALELPCVHARQPILAVRGR